MKFTNMERYVQSHSYDAFLLFFLLEKNSKCRGYSNRNLILYQHLKKNVISVSGASDR